MVHICFGLNDSSGKYTKFTGITIMSIFHRTFDRVTVHVLHDDSVSEENLERLKSLGDGKNKLVKLYRVESSSFAAIKGDGFNIGTMYRLAIPDIIPKSISKLIYLDSDIIVNLDIRKLYDLDLNGTSLAALPSPAPGFWVYDENIVECYFNNGVMLLDLQKIRCEHKLLEETKSFFDSFHHEPTCDQDAFNYIFQKDWTELPKMFNQITIELRGKSTAFQDYLYHYAGDTPNAVQIEEFDRLFFSYWLASPWVDQFQEYFAETVRIREGQLVFMQHLLAQFNKRIVVWGAGSKYLKMVLKHLPSGKILLVDRDKGKWGKKVCGIVVQDPTYLDKIKDYIVLILSGQYYGEISQTLRNYGLKENEDYFDGRLLLNEDEGGRMVSVGKGNLREDHWRYGSINSNLLNEECSNN